MRAWIRVNGDVRAERSLFLTSVKLDQKGSVDSSSDNSNNAADTCESATMVINRNDYKQLLKDLGRLSRDLEAMQERLKNLELN